MAKLLKHFGFGYGNNKKSETFDFRAKTLPASTANHNAAGDPFNRSARRNTCARSHTVECGDATSLLSSSCRTSNETFLTIPVRGRRARSERDRSREQLKPAVACGKPRESESTGIKAKCDAGAKELRRSITAEEILSTKSNNITLSVSIK